ncbi:MAG: ATP-binding protein, partial [Isosphaeraceae bacterium]
DEAADRLRREADRVAARARLLAERSRLAELREALDSQTGSLKSTRERLNRQWMDLWSAIGISRPGAPRAMLAWLREHAELARRARDLREARGNLARLEAKAETLRDTLAAALETAGEPAGGPEESFTERRERAEEALTLASTVAVERARLLAERDRLDAERPALERAVEAAAAQHDVWQTRWAVAMARFGLPTDASPASLNALLAQSAELFERIEQARAHRRQSEVLSEESSRFTSEVRALVARVAPDLLGPATPTGAWPSQPWGFDDPGLARSATASTVFLPEAETSSNPSTENDSLTPADAANLVRELSERLRKARAARQSFEHLTQALEEKRNESHAAKAEVRSLHDVLADLRREARLADVDDDDGGEDRLEEAATNDRRRAELEAQRERDDEAIRKLAAGMPLEAFAAEVAGVDPDSLGPRIARLTQRIGELQRDAEEVNQAIGRETSELARMKGGSDAAEICQNAENLRAKVKADVEQYTRLRLAMAVLRAGVERYRKKAQGPVLARASATFARLTLGSFHELTIEYDDRDEPVLRATRPGGEPLGVDAMSLGTADQLYLALRLATLDAFLDRHEPLPLIADDVLIQFDDARAAATLEVLAEFAERTQVLLFTHHEHLIELARARLAPGAFFTHALPGRIPR